MNFIKRRWSELEGSVQARVSGEYRFVKVHEPTGHATQDTGWFSNMILDAGYSAWLGDAGHISRCVIGTGTAAPGPGQTALQSQAAASTAMVLNSAQEASEGTPYSSWTGAWRFASGSLNGTYTEVGCGNTDSMLFSRALILDGAGNPTTISVGPTERLDVYYRLRRYLPLGLSTSGTVSILGVSRNYTVRGIELSAGNWRVSGVRGLAVGGVGGGARSSPAASQWVGSSWLSSVWGFDEGKSLSRSGETVTITATRGLGASASPFSALALGCGEGSEGGAVVEVALDPPVSTFTADHTLTLSVSYGISRV